MENKEHLNDNISKKEIKILFSLLFVPCLFIRRVLDNDTWFLLNSGRYVMNYGIPHIEPFSIHQNMEFVMQQWLTDVIFWNTYEKFGENGLFLIVTICYATIIFLVLRLCMKISEDNYFISFTITLLASILVYTYMVTRPTIFTLVIVMIELNVLEKFIISGKNKYLIILPFLSLLMINLHAALWPILFILILPYLIDSFNFKRVFISGEGYEKKYLFLIVVTMILVAFINPYGTDSMVYLIKSMGYSEMNSIMEIQPPNVNNFFGALIYIYIAFIAFVYIGYKGGKTKIRYILLTVGTTYMVLCSVRNITYFAICSLFPLSYYLKDFKFKSKYSYNRKNKNTRIILIILIMAITFFFVFENRLNNSTYTEYLELNNTIDYIIENEDVYNVILYTGFNEGGLVQFRGMPTYIDPRAEVYFKKQNNKDDIFKEYFDLIKGRVYYKEILDKYKFTHLIVSEGDLLCTYLKNDINYKIIFENDKYKLYKKLRLNY